MLCLCRLPCEIFSTMSRRSLSTDQKLDALIKSVAELKMSHDSSHKELEGKLQKLEEDVAASQELQEDATERTVKRLRRDKPYEFRHKGHKEQYRFNSGIADHVATATTQLDNIQPASDKDKARRERSWRKVRVPWRNTRNISA